MHNGKKVICNKCGKELRYEKGYLKEGSFHGECSFGYFSNKDGLKHRFDLCEACYDEMISHFKIPVEIIREKELV